jgi:hypothetical protein
MSGGPAFDASGNVIGVLSSSFAMEGDERGPSYVSLLDPVFCARFPLTWPRDAGSASIVELAGRRVFVQRPDAFECTYDEQTGRTQQPGRVVVVGPVGYASSKHAGARDL